MTPDEYCQDKAVPNGSSLHYSLLPLPDERRRVFIALYAFRREIIQIVDECQEAPIARTKLDWWREELHRLFAGQPQHPVSLALAVRLDRYTLAQERFREMLDGVEMDLHYDAYPSFKELSLYCQRVGSAVSLLGTEILGYEDRRTPQFANNLGMALQLVCILRNVHRDALRGRFYLPEDELERFGVGHADLLRSPTSEPVQALFRFQAERVKEHQQRALQQLPAQDRYAQCSYIILAELAMRLLDEIAADGYRLLEQRIALTPLRKFWIAWRTERRERRAHQRHLAGHDLS